MPFTGTLVQLLTSLGTQFPLLAVWVIGAVLAVAFWKRDPRSALLVVLVCLIGLFDVVAFAIVYAVLPRFLHGGMDLGGISMQMIYSVVGLVRSCLMAVAWTLLLVAVFRRRPVT